MRLTSSLILLLFILLLAGCQPRNGNTGALQTTDSIHADINGFLGSLISGKNIAIDTNWYRYWDSTEIGIPQWGDDPDTFVRFPFKDIALSYHTIFTDDGTGDKNFFSLNKQKFTDTVGNSNDQFSSNIYKFSYRGQRYLSFTGNPRHFNGSGGRININYFFDLDQDRPLMDVYENAWGYADHPLLYGDLDDDAQLDRIKFDGVIPGIDTTYVFRIDAETYKDHAWQPLKDKEGQRYFIELYCDGMMENLRLKSAHWMHALPR